MLQVENTITGSVEEWQDIIRQITVNQLSGQVNVTFKHDGIHVWQPSRMPAPDDIGQDVVHLYDFHNQIKKDKEQKNLQQANVIGSVSVPAVRVRFCPKDVDETFDGTVIEETKYSYLVIPDDNITGTARWNKKYCDVLR